MSKIKQDIAKQRLRLTAAALKVYNEKYLKGDVPTPMDVMEEIMINAPRDSDRIKAASELIRMCYQSPPRESEVSLTDEAGSMTSDEREELRILLAQMNKDN